MRDFIKEASKRWKSDLPPFFKKLRAFGLSLAGLGVSLLTPQALGMDTSFYPSFLIELSKDIATVGTVIAAVSQFAQQQIQDNTTTDAKESN